MMNPAACSLGRPGHVEVDPCRRIGTGGATKSQRVTMRPEVMYAALRFNRDVATFPSALLYRRVQFLEKVLLYLRSVSFNCVL